MVKLHFEKNLEHQRQAVEATIKVFDGVEQQTPKGVHKNSINPTFNYQSLAFKQNIKQIQRHNGIEAKPTFSNIIDIMMETGTGKTYTYTKTIFELNQHYGIFKFIVVVPTLPIKAGTIDFLQSDSTRGHFQTQYNKRINLHIVQSENKKANKKSSAMPPAISEFVKAQNHNNMEVMIINAGMINSDTMGKTYDTTLFDRYKIPFEGIAETKPFIIIDEPHKFDKKNKTWENIQKFNAQCILRYGATFPEKQIKRPIPLLKKKETIKIKDYHNLIYELKAIDAFNQKLVKGVIGHITEFAEGQKVMVQLTGSDDKEASFKLIGTKDKNSVKLTKKQSLSKIHQAIDDLCIDKLNKTEVILSNGLQLKKGDKISPFSYHQTLQEYMIAKAVGKHFEKERAYLTQEVKIKPLTLFFIDNIDEYRDQEGSIRQIVETQIKAQAEGLLEGENNAFYKSYLEQTLKDIAQTHGGYFSKDNSDKDDKIEKEVNEILHDKQALLDLNNTRRFIFSKWTLKEGWDNPNIFQICKLRSSGSEISKLQEVGRGLRLPVNEYGNRVKDIEFYLDYFVDFTEDDFIDQLVQEVNHKSNAFSREAHYDKLSDEMVGMICKHYSISEEDLLKSLDEQNLITRANQFKEGGLDYIREHYPLIFAGVDSNQIRKDTDTKPKAKIRVEKYPQLQALWEKLNQKVILEYNIKNEPAFKDLLNGFLENATSFVSTGITEKTQQIKLKKDEAFILEETSISDSDLTAMVTMPYDKFLKQLAKALHINMKTLHNAFVDLHIPINQYLNQTTIRSFKQKFNNYLMHQAINDFGIAYQQVTNAIHPTKLTNTQGDVQKEINAADVGVLQSGEKVADKYLFEQLFYDSELEKENIKQNIQEVIVFTKIPKNSIKIPVAGGKSYSPDFAYVFKSKDGNEQLHFIVETKNADEEGLRAEEQAKIQYAEQFFKGAIKVKFETQFKEQTIIELIEKAYNGQI